MTDIESQCHHLWTLLLMWTCDSEWYVKWECGRFHAEHPTKKEPEPCGSMKQAESEWHKFFKVKP